MDGATTACSAKDAAGILYVLLLFFNKIIKRTSELPLAQRCGIGTLIPTGNTGVHFFFHLARCGTKFSTPGCCTYQYMEFEHKNHNRRSEIYIRCIGPHSGHKKCREGIKHHFSQPPVGSPPAAVTLVKWERR